jgi:glycogen debranching enzyme
VDNDRGRYPALALDADKRPVDALTSNIGHLLGTGLLDAEETRAVVTALGSDELAGGYGLRTMATGDTGYAPLAYHCGAVWPHDTAIVVTGLARLAGAGDSGAGAVAAGLIDGLLSAAAAFDYRLPELYGGDPRTSHGRPVPHPGACHPQAWAGAASIALLQAALGIEADVPGGRLRVRPLTGALGDLEVAGLSVAGAPVRVRVVRDGSVEVAGTPDGLALDLPGGTGHRLPEQRSPTEDQLHQ